MSERSWDQVLSLARGIAGLANDGLDGPADDQIVKDDANKIAAIAEEHGAALGRPTPPMNPRPRPFPGAALASLPPESD